MLFDSVNVLFGSWIELENPASFRFAVSHDVTLG